MICINTAWKVLFKGSLTSESIVKNAYIWLTTKDHDNLFQSIFWKHNGVCIWVVLQAPKLSHITDYVVIEDAIAITRIFF